MTNYAAGHVKRDPETGTVAVRTGFPDEPPFTGQAWLTATVRNGAHFRSTADVDGWPDLYEPEPDPEGGREPEDGSS